MKQSLALTAAGIVGIALAAWARPGIAADATALWDKNCASCHGKDGKGDTKAGRLTKVEDLTAADVRSTLTRDTVRQSIENGIVDETTKKTRMKGYKDKFSPDEIDALVTHVLGLAGPAQ
jgi:mono/diheme cytochrome c family protein